MGKLIEVTRKLENEFRDTPVLISEIEDAVLRDWLKVKAKIQKKGNGGGKLKFERSLYTLRQRIKNSNPKLYEASKQYKEIIMGNPNILPIAWAIHAVKLYKYKATDEQLCLFYRIDYDDYMVVKSWWERNHIQEKDVREWHHKDLIRVRPPSLSSLYKKYWPIINKLINSNLCHPQVQYVFELYEEKDYFKNALLQKALTAAFERHYMPENEMGKWLNKTLRNEFLSITKYFTSDVRAKHTYKNNKFSMRTVSYNTLIDNTMSLENYDILQFEDDPIKNIETKRRISGQYNEELCDYICEHGNNDSENLRKFLNYVLNCDKIEHINLIAKRYGVSLYKLRNPKIRKYLENLTGRRSTSISNSVVSVGKDAGLSVIDA